MSLAEGQTCEQICLENVLCSVWQLAWPTYSTVDKAECWQGGTGRECYSERSDFNYKAKRVMHGTYRVLKDITGIEVMGLTKMFGIDTFSNSPTAAPRCRLHCIGNLGCQWWLYSNISGCWVEDASNARVNYPLINTPKVSNQGTRLANAVVAGEYIQHYCGGNTESAGVNAAEVAYNSKFEPSTFKSSLSTTFGDLWSNGTFLSVLLLVLVVLGALIGGAVWWCCLRRRKKSSKASRQRGAEVQSEEDFTEMSGMEDAEERPLLSASRRSSPPPHPSPPQQNEEPPKPRDTWPKEAEQFLGGSRALSSAYSQGSWPSTAIWMPQQQQWDHLPSVSQQWASYYSPPANAWTR